MTRRYDADGGHAGALRAFGLQEAVSEIRGLYDRERGEHDWVCIGVYGSRAAALAAIRWSR